jgi:hypothetical protein
MGVGANDVVTATAIWINSGGNGVEAEGGKTGGDVVGVGSGVDAHRKSSTVAAISPIVPSSSAAPCSSEGGRYGKEMRGGSSSSGCTVHDRCLSKAHSVSTAVRINDASQKRSFAVIRPPLPRRIHRHTHLA